MTRDGQEKYKLCNNSGMQLPTSCMRSRERMLSKVSNDGERPP
jgi:hypothetical protein